MKIDVKSLLIGVLMTVIVVMSLGSGRNSEQRENRRYQGITANGFQGVYVLDTKTSELRFASIVDSKQIKQGDMVFEETTEGE